MPKVSVIIPNYNHCRFLEQRLRSVLGQTFQDFELIYLDDASTDQSEAVFARFAGDPRVRAIRNQTNSGSTFKQWNRGVRAARGEYIWIAESDDYADERLLATLAEQLDREPRAGIAYCQSWQVDIQGQTLGSMERWTAGLDPQRWADDFVNDGRDECARYLIIKNTIPNASAVLFRRAIYEQAGGADESMRYCGDWKTWVHMLLISDIAFVAQPLNYFRAHDTTVRSRFTGDLTAIAEAYEIIADILAAVVVAAPTLELVRNGIAARWAGVLRANMTSLAHSRQVYPIARRVDRQINRRLAQKLFDRGVGALRRRISR
jgi:glycosyltransferase involved in cell wall biosynthesis